MRPLPGPGAITAALAAAILLAAPRFGPATDALLLAVPRPSAEVPVLALAVPEAEWPWPRARWAAEIARLTAAGARAIALDVAFIEPAAGDAELAAALAAGPTLQGLLAGAAPAAVARAPGVARLGSPDLAKLVALPGLALPALPDAPGAPLALPGAPIRAVPLLVRVGEELLPGLALAAIARALGADTLLLAPGRLGLGPFDLPLPEGARLLLHPAATRLPLLPARGVPDAAIAGRIVLLGTVAPAAAPLRPSPFGPFTPSLQLQAEAVAQLLAGWLPRRLPHGIEAGLAGLLGLGAAFAVRARAGAGLALTLALALAWPLGAAAALRWGALLADPAGPALAVLAAGGVEAAALARRAARDRARLVARFAHRLAPGVAAALLARPEAERLRPERREVAVVLTDLAGFTTLVREGPPQAVLAALNAYLAGIEAAVLASGGTLERLIGDSVLAVFGAPVPLADAAGRALSAARAIDAFAEAFRIRPDAVALGWGATRIGVAQGPVLVGEVGGTRLTWTVLGDAANLAARLQELGRTLERRALVAGIEDPSLGPPLGAFALRGFDAPIAVAAL